MKEKMAVSAQLAQAITFLRDCEREYKYYYEKVGEQEKKQNDLLHFLELDKNNYAGRCKTATQLRKCLLERRFYKDRVEERSPIVEFLSDVQNKKLLDSLGRVLGEVRKAERYHQNRSYTPRVLRYSNENDSNLSDKDDGID